MRRTIISVLVVVLAAFGLAAVAMATGSGSSVTQARLERSLPVVFSNIYAQEARLVGHRGVTPASLHAKAMCDNGAGNVGPGATWVCLMSWQDPSTPMPSTGYGKFELNVHSNDCYTVGSPSSLIGYQTLTDAAGRTVNNPAFEFDGCFDPHATNAPTGVTFPSAFTITTTALSLDASGRASLAMTCGTGFGGCSGSLAVSVGKVKLGSVPYRMAENSTTTITLPEPLPTAAKDVTIDVSMTRGVGSSSADLPIQSR
jgi:hypothetical protein